MNLVVTLLSLLAIVLLIAGNALFIAAEFSLTTLERSTVEANARHGGRRDRYVRRAHHTLAFQLVRSAAGHLDHHAGHRISRPSRWWRSCRTRRWTRSECRNRIADAVIAFLALVVVTSVSMVFGELVPKNLAVARPLPTARAVAGPQLLFSFVMTFGDPADKRRGQPDPAQAGRRARPGACGRPARRRNWFRWSARLPAAARWTPPPRRYCTDHCSSAR